jgi:hypothetical protein
MGLHKQAVARGPVYDCNQEPRQRRRSPHHLPAAVAA